MLNRDKVAKEIENLAEKIFLQQQFQETISASMWHDMVNHPLFTSRIAAVRDAFSLASWQGCLTDTFQVNSSLSEYKVLAVDGSQIYPDRHIEGVGCFLLNAGGCLLQYGSQSKATLFSEPCVCIPESVVQKNDDIAFSADLVDLKREALELEVACKKSLEAREQHPSIPFVCLFDGSLIFWHLEAKPPEVRDLFLKTYLALLDQLYQHKIIMASYVSLPKSKELAHLLKIGTCGVGRTDTFGCGGKYQQFPCNVIDDIIDSHCLRNVIAPGMRTTVLYSNAKIVAHYPEHLKPCFFYMNVGKEIVRIEFPRWILDHDNALELISSVCLNQAIKGYGYPVALAEAHEQAVIKGPDRDFFYHLLYKIGIEQKHQVVVSQKSLKKRGIGI